LLPTLRDARLLKLFDDMMAFLGGNYELIV